MSSGRLSYNRRPGTMMLRTSPDTSHRLLSETSNGPAASLVIATTDAIVWPGTQGGPAPVAEGRVRVRGSAIIAAVLLILLVIGAALLIAMDPGRRTTEEGERLTGAGRGGSDADQGAPGAQGGSGAQGGPGTPAEAFPLIAIEPSSFAGMQGPDLPEWTRDGGTAHKPQDAGSDAMTYDAVDVEVLTPPVDAKMPETQLERLPEALMLSAAEPLPQAEQSAVATADVAIALPAPSPVTVVSTVPEVWQEPVQSRAAQHAATEPAASGPESLPRRETLDPTLLMDRGNALLAQSDINSARLFFRLAAEQGSAAGAMAMAMTYDPLVPGVAKTGAETGAETGKARANPTAAVDWYRRAAQLGERDAAPRAAHLIDVLARRSAGGDAAAKAALYAIGP